MNTHSVGILLSSDVIENVSDVLFHVFGSSQNLKIRDFGYFIGSKFRRIVWTVFATRKISKQLEISEQLD